MVKSNRKKLKIWTYVCRVLFVICFVTFIICFFLGEWKRNSYDTGFDLTVEKYDDGWTVTSADGSSEQVTKLPAVYKPTDGQVILSRTIGSEAVDGNYIRYNSRGDSFTCYVDDQVRFECQSSFMHPSGYFLIPLQDEDAGKELRLVIETEEDSVKVLSFAYGKQSACMMDLFDAYKIELAMSIFLLIMSLLTIAFGLVVQIRTGDIQPIKYLGAGLFLSAIWILCNSELRQFILPNLDVTRATAFLTVAIVPIPYLIYMDILQRRRYNSWVMHLVILSAVNFLFQLLCYFTRWIYLPKIFPISIGTALLTILSFAAMIIIDGVRGKLKSYLIAAIGLFIFSGFAIAQILIYVRYENGNVSSSVLAIGLFFLLIFSFIDTINGFMRLYRDRKTALGKVEKLTIQSMETIAMTVDAKDAYTSGHSLRVAQYSKELAWRMGLSKEEQSEIYYMGLLHDVGKLGIPDNIINKTGRLTDEEFSVIKKHPEIGAKILKGIKEVPNVADGAHWHHERYDGKGYPDGLKGEEIPLKARIIAVADAYDAMTSNRSYRSFLPQEAVRAEVEKNIGKQFDPVVAKHMLDMIDADTEYLMREFRPSRPEPRAEG